MGRFPAPPADPYINHDRNLAALAAGVNICITQNMKKIAEKRGRGRPYSGGGSPLIALRLPAELIAAIDAALAAEETRSVMIRQAIEREIRRRRRLLRREKESKINGLLTY